MEGNQCKTEVSSEIKYSCNLCLRLFDDAGALLRHQVDHVVDKVFNCDCGKQFKQRFDLKRHMKVHTDVQDHSCEVCGKSFTEHSDLNRHSHIHTGDHYQFECPQCKKKLTTRTNLKYHMKSKHKIINVLDCPGCLHTFKCSLTLKQHQESGTCKERFKCQHCGKIYRSNIDLQRHVRSHTGQTPFSCCECGKSFALRSSLVCHSRMHSGVRPYACSVCGRCFNQNGNMHKHMRSHDKNLYTFRGGKGAPTKTLIIQSKKMATKIDKVSSTLANRFSSQAVIKEQGFVFEEDCCYSLDNEVLVQQNNIINEQTCCSAITDYNACSKNVPNLESTSLLQQNSPRRSLRQIEKKHGLKIEKPNSTTSKTIDTCSSHYPNKMLVSAYKDPNKGNKNKTSSFTTKVTESVESFNQKLNEPAIESPNNKFRVEAQNINCSTSSISHLLSPTTRQSNDQFEYSPALKDVRDLVSPSKQDIDWNTMDYLLFHHNVHTDTLTINTEDNTHPKLDITDCKEADDAVFITDCKEADDAVFQQSGNAQSPKHRYMCEHGRIDILKIEPQFDSVVISNNSMDSRENPLIKDEHPNHFLDSDFRHISSVTDEAQTVLDTNFTHNTNLSLQNTILSTVDISPVCKSPNITGDVHESQQDSSNLSGRDDPGDVTSSNSAVSGKKSRPVVVKTKVNESHAYNCLECGFVCESMLEIGQHMISNVHKDTSSPERTKNKPRNKTITKCPDCGKLFMYWHNFRNHYLLHKKERPYSCNICNAVFTTMARQKNHMRVHAKRKFKCGDCESRFYCQSDLVRHLRRHSGEKPFSCSDCPKRFALTSTLVKHQRLHTGEKPYTCTICNQRFTQNGNMKQHIKTHDNSGNTRANKRRHVQI